MAMSLAQAHEQGCTLVEHHTARFVAYVRDLDPAAAALPVPGLAWTVGETVAHVRSVYERYTVDRRRATSADDVARANAEDVTRLGVDLNDAVRSIEEQAALFPAVVAAVPPDTLFPFHAGARITVAGGWGNLLGELLAHGDDLARATGRPFGVPGDDLEILWRFTLPVLGAWLRPESASLEETWLLRLPVGDLHVALDSGRLLVADDRAGRPADHVLEVPDLARFTLEVPYRRRPHADPLTALLGSRFRDV